MEQLSNLDVIILITMALSALLAFYRGLIKEVLSIIGWILLTMMMIYAMPLVTPLLSDYIESGVMTGIASAVLIIVVFFILWYIITSYIVGKIRSAKKLNLADRFLGLFFGLMRAALFVVLLYIAIGWVVPYNEQPEFFTKSKYYNLAGTFAEPIENLIPKETLDIIKVKDKEKSKEAEEKVQKEMDSLFEKLAQPKIKSKSNNKISEEEKTSEGYEKKERNDMDRLMENIAE